MRRRRIAKLVGGLLGIPILLVVLAVASVHLGIFNATIRSFTEGTVASALDAKLEIGALRGSVFTTLHARNVVLSTADGVPIIRVDELDASASLPALLATDIIVDVDVRGLDAFLEADEEGNLNIVSIVKPSEDEEETELPVSLDLRFDVEDSSVVWRDQSIPSTDDPLAPIEADYDRSELRTLVSKKVETPTEMARSAPRSAALPSLDGSVRFVLEKNGTSRIGVSELRSPATASGISGHRDLSIEDFVLVVETNGTLRTSFQGLDVAEWLSLRNVRAVIDPERLEQTGIEVGKLEATKSLLQLAVPEAIVRTGVTISARAAPTKEGATSLTADVGFLDVAEQRISVAAVVSNWVEPGPDTTWDVHVSGQGLKPTELFGVTAPVRAATLFASANGTGIDPETLSADLRVGVRATEIDAYRIESAYLEATAREGVFTLTDAFVFTPYASTSANAKWTNETGEFQADARAVSTDAMAGVAQRLLGQKLDVQADLEAHAHGRLDLEQEDPLAIVRALDAQLEWTVKDFSAEDVTIRRSKGRAEAKVSDTGERRRVSYDVRASANNVRTADLKLAKVSIDSRGDSSLDPGAIDTMSALKRLTSRVDLEVQGLVAGSTVVRDIDLLASVKPRRGRLAYDIEASAQKTFTDGVQIEDAALDIDGTLTLGNSLAWPAALRALSVKGQLAGQGLSLGSDKAGSLAVGIDVSGPIDDLGGSVEADAVDLKIADYDFATIAAKISFTGDREFRIDADARQREGTPEQVGIFARGRYTRDLTDYTILELEFFTSGEKWKLTDGFSFDTKQGSFRFDDVTLSHGEQTVKLDGYFKQGDSQDLEAKIEKLDLATIVEEFGLSELDPLRGQVDAEAEVGGTAQEPTARFRIELTDLYWGEYGPFRVLLEGRYGERKLVVERLEADGYDIRLLEGNASLPVRVTTTGDFDVSSSDPIDIFLETPTFQASKLYGVVDFLRDWSVSGQLGMTTRLRGTLDDPSLNAEVRVDDVTSTGTPDSAGVSLGPVDAVVALRYSNPEKAGGGLEASLNAAWEDEPPIQGLARIRADAALWLREYLAGKEVDWIDRFERSEWKLLAKAQKFDLRNLRVGAMKEADVEGVLSLDVTAGGTLSNPQSTFKIDLDDFGWERYRDVYFDADAALQKERLELRSARLEWDADEILTAHGSIPTPFSSIFGDAPLGDLPVDFEVELKPLPVAKFSAVDYTFASISGELSGYARLKGTLNDPEFDGRFSAIDVEFSDKSRGTFATKLEFSKDKKLSADVVICRGPKEVLVASYKMPLPLDLVAFARGEELDIGGEVEARIKGENVRLAGLVPRKVIENSVSKVAGRLSVDMKMTGPLTRPEFEGRLQLDEAGFFLGQYSRGFGGIEVDVVAEKGGRVVLHDFLVREERGFVSASGEVMLDGWQPGQIDASAELDNFGTAGLIDYSMFLSADLDVTGDLSGETANAEANISGLEVVIPDSIDESTLPTSLDTDIVVIRRKRDREQLLDFELEDEGDSGLVANLDVTIERNSWLRHPQAEVEFMGDVQVELSPSSVTLGGEVQTLRGAAEVLGKRFELDKGLITFTGADPPDPRLQIEAAYKLDRSITRALGQPTSGEPRAIVRVTGQVSDPRIRFLSDPEMPESDVIYVLLTNRPPGQAEVGETEAGGLAAGAASGLASGLIQEKLGKVLPVDVFRVEAGDEGFADPRFEVGKYVRKDVFLSLEYQVAAEQNENSTELNVEYRFLPRWVLVFEAGNLGTGELNVFWDVY